MKFIIMWIWNNTRIVSIGLLIGLSVLGVKHTFALLSLGKTEAQLQEKEKELIFIKASIDKLKLDYEYSIQTLENENRLLSQRHEAELREIELRWEKNIPDNVKCEDAVDFLKKEAIRLSKEKSSND